MWLEIGNVWTKLTRSTPQERAWVASYLTFESTSFRKKTKPVSLFNSFASAFPSGFVSLVKKAGAEEGFKVELVDGRSSPALDPNADLAWLRDYQVEGVKRSVERQRGILWLPTAAGKTEIMVGLTRAVPCRWLALVHRAQLADEIASRYEKRSPGLFAGRVLEGGWDVPEDAGLVAATFQSINAALKDERPEVTALLRSARGLAVDECHTLPSASFWSVSMKCSRAHYRIGFSGTPLARGDRKSLYAIAALGPVIYRVKPDILIERGVLARPTVRLAPCVQSSLHATWAGAYSSLVVNSAKRNALVVELAKRAERPGFIFIKELAHGHALTKLLGAAGIKAEFIHGDHGLDWRKSHIKRLVAGHFDFIVCSSVFDQGIDVPALRSVINASGGKSVISTLQRLGRGMRVERDANENVVEGGDRFEVWDIDDQGNKWTARHSRARMAAYAGEGYETIIEKPAP